ncbi:MAG TPA: hypothetical protein VL133_15970 [Devosia sp.]|nr:hypothetical protein [Devosia sp.]
MKFPCWAAALALAACLPAEKAAAFDLFAGTGIAVQSIALSHDSSALFPLYGNPTSILDYQVLVAPSLVLGGRGPVRDWYVEGEVALTGFGTGAFRDTDYLAGGTRFSETFSDAGVDGGISGTLRFSPGFVPILPVGEAGWVRPYVVAGAEVQSITASGLACGTPCSSPAVAASTAVIQHWLSGARLGLGMAAELPVGDDNVIAIRGEVFGGTANVDDTHLLRSDLGPAPNISYRNLMLGTDLELRYERRLSETLKGWISASGGRDWGWGTAEFGPGTATPLTVPASFDRVRLRLDVGLAGSF